MKFSYKFTEKKEKQAYKVYEILVENFSQSFIVGGTIRDMLLRKKLTDFDFATSAKPHQVVALLKKYGIKTDEQHKRYGIIIAKLRGLEIEIATLRKDSITTSRYPEVTFISSPKVDSKRRDFSMNSLYFKPKNNIVYDYHKGTIDIKNKVIKFIGNPTKRIKEDPLRIVRAYRFMLQLNFKLDAKTATALTNNMHLLEQLSDSRIRTEINKLATKDLRKKLCTIINKNT